MVCINPISGQYFFSHENVVCLLRLLHVFKGTHKQTREQTTMVVYAGKRVKSIGSSLSF